MANYRKHSQFNLLLALPVLAAIMYWLLATPWQLIATFSGAFAYGTLFMSPDMDLAYQIRILSVRGILTIPFRSYATFFRHRGLSHHPLFGTATRLAWLLAWVSLFLYLFYNIQPDVVSFQKFCKQNSTWIIYGVSGVLAADLCHLLLD